MLHSQTVLRTRPISAGYLRAFEAVARHLNFRAAAEEMALTQSAVSRQIQALEEEVGVGLFLRHTRAVELTGAGAQLLQAVQRCAAAPGRRGAPDPPERRPQDRVGHHLRIVRVDVADPAAGAVPARQPRHRHPHRRHRHLARPRGGRRRPGAALRPGGQHAAQGDPPVRRAADAGGQSVAAQDRHRRSASPPTWRSSRSSRRAMRTARTWSG